MNTFISLASWIQIQTHQFTSPRLPFIHIQSMELSALSIISDKPKYINTYRHTDKCQFVILFLRILPPKRTGQILKRDQKVVARKKRDTFELRGHWPGIKKAYQNVTGQGWLIHDKAPKTTSWGLVILNTAFIWNLSRNDSRTYITLV